MVIESRFNIGDEVFILNGDEVQRCRISRLRIGEFVGKLDNFREPNLESMTPKIKYSFQDPQNGQRELLDKRVLDFQRVLSKDESKVFSTKEELIKSL